MIQYVSKRAWLAAGILITLHLVMWAYVGTQDVLYDQGGLEGMMWWLVTFFVLPVAALLAILASAANKAFGLWGE